MLSQMLVSLAFGFLHYTEMERGQHLYIHFTHRNTVARFLLLHKFGGYLAHILLIERRAAKVGFDIADGQDTQIAVVRLVGDIVFRYGGQRVQRNAEGLDAFDISHLLACMIFRSIKLKSDEVISASSD